MDDIPETLKAGFQQIRAETGLSAVQVLKAYARYHPSVGHKMLLSEFMAYGLWRHETVPDGFIGTREASEFALAVNFQPHKRGLVGDKLLFDATLRGLGFPVPALQAIFGAKKLPPPIFSLGHKAAVAKFLQEDAVYPIFGKPLSGQNGEGVISIESFDPETGRLHLTTGETTALESVVNMVAPAYFHRGYMFQSRIRQQAALSASIGEAVGSVRVITFLAASKPRIIGAFWKLPDSGMMADNLLHGGWLASVTPETGRVGRLREGLGPVARWHDTHPVSGAPIAGIALPHWGNVCELVTHAARLLNGLPLVGWDIAFGENGPIIIEANTVPSLDMLQYGVGTPALPAALRAEMVCEVDRLRRVNKLNRTARQANMRAMVRKRLSRAFGIGRS